MQEHIEWLKSTIEIAEEQSPILVNALKLCLNDATQRLEMERKQIIWAHGIQTKGVNDHKCVTGEQYYNETFKSE